MSEYVYCWRVQDAYDLTGIGREKLVASLAGISGAIQEYFSWGLVTTSSLSSVSPSADLLLRASLLHGALLKLADKEAHQARGILRDVIMTVYEGERPDMDDLPDVFPGDDTFLEKRLRPLYLDSLLLKRADVRTYCQANEIRQVRGVKGLMMGNAYKPPQVGSWITGAEVMKKYKVLAVEIGRACYSGELQAYSSALLPILDATKTEKIQAWPHESENNDIDKLFSKLDRGEKPSALEALAIVNAATGDCRYLFSLNTIANLSYIPKNEKGNLFSFLWDDYFKEVNSIIASILKEHPDNDEKMKISRRLFNEELIFGEYTEHISKMLFKHGDIISWMDTIPAEHGNHSFNTEQPSLDMEQIDSASPQPQPLAIPSAQLPPIKKRVSSEGNDNEQVRNTCQENPEALAYVEARRQQGATAKEIAGELAAAGGGTGVIGCLIDPTRQNITAAREHGKYLTKDPKKQ